MTAGGFGAAGDWGDGVTLAPFTGELVADILSGHASPIDRTLLSHERFETSDSRHGQDALIEAISPQKGARE